MNNSRQTTLNSLIGVVAMLNADDEQIFNAGYQLATHDLGGHELWKSISKNKTHLKADEIAFIEQHYKKNDSVYGATALARRFGVSRDIIRYIIKMRGIN